MMSNKFSSNSGHSAGSVVLFLHLLSSGHDRRNLKFI